MPSNLIEVYTNCYGPFGVKSAIEWVAKCGIERIELALTGHGGVLQVPDTAVPDIKAGQKACLSLQKDLSEHGVIALSGHGQGDIRQSEGLESLKAQLDFCYKVGGRYFLFSAPTPSDDEDRKRILDLLLQFADYALGLGITLCLETHPGLTLNGDEMLRTMKDLNHRTIRLNFDTANILYYNRGVDVLEELLKVRDYVSHFHLKDSRGVFEEWYFPALGEGGAVDFWGVFQIMNEAGFYGPFSIEIEGIEGEPDLSLEERHERVRTSIEYLRSIKVI